MRPANLSTVDSPDRAPAAEGRPMTAAGSVDPRHPGQAGITAVVPLSPLTAAKQRLAPAVDAATRLALVEWMLGRVLSALTSSGEVADLFVMAGDEDAAALARTLGAAAVRQSGTGLQEALDEADALTQGCPGTLVMASDLPLVEPEDVAALCAAGRLPGVVIAPTQDGGTAALLRRPPTAMRTAFGPGSAGRHGTRARTLGLGCTTLDRARLAIDIDTPAALVAAGMVGWLRPGPGRPAAY